jgi:hypothetical protein
LVEGSRGWFTSVEKVSRKLFIQRSFSIFPEAKKVTAITFDVLRDRSRLHVRATRADRTIHHRGPVALCSRKREIRCPRRRA